MSLYLTGQLIVPQIEESRYQRLREAINSLHPATTPTDCLSLLVRHTPAQLYMTNLKIKINKPTAASLGNGELLKILKQAKGLLVLELELQVDLPGIMGFVYQLRHVREIKLLSGLGQTECYEREMALRNKNWVQPGEEVENTGGMTPEPGWVVLKVVCRR